jgi:hypothetical protein
MLGQVVNSVASNWPHNFFLKVSLEGKTRVPFPGRAISHGTFPLEKLILS